MIRLEFPSVLHPGALATPCTIVLIPGVVAASAGAESTVNEVLLGAVDGLAVSSDSEGALRGCVSSESPA